MTRIHRRVRKQTWKILGYASPRAYRLERETQWRRSAPMRRSMELLAQACAEFAIGLAKSFAMFTKNMATAFAGLTLSMHPPST